MRFHNVTRALFASFILLAPAAAQAQDEAPVTPDAAADFQAMRQKAQGNESLQNFLRMVERSRSQSEGRDQIKQYVMERAGRRLDLSKPVEIMAIMNIDIAQRRGAYAGQILSADLDGDWQVTLKELRSVLVLGQNEGQNNDGAAEAFILADADNDSVLSTDEIKQAVEARVAGQSSRRGDFREALILFDFNGDGQMTPEEFERGLVALLD